MRLKVLTHASLADKWKKVARVPCSNLQDPKTDADLMRSGLKARAWVEGVNLFLCSCGLVTGTQYEDPRSHEGPITKTSQRSPQQFTERTINVCGNYLSVQSPKY